MLNGDGMVTERRDSNRILYSLVEDRLALSVGEFLSTVCPEQILLRGIRNRKAGSSSASGQQVSGQKASSQQPAASTPTRHTAGTAATA